MLHPRFHRSAACAALIAAVLAISCTIGFAADVQGGPNLLDNGDFSRGSGNSVNGWRNDAWILTPGTTDYLWIPPQGNRPAEVEVFSRHDNDARWAQTLNLAQGWYHVSVEARTVNVLPFMIGANISTLEDGIRSEDLKGTQSWHRLGFYLKVGPNGADVDIALRLGGYMNLSYGRVFFRDASVVKIAAPPPGATEVYDLDAIRKNETTGPVGQPWTLVATFLLFVIVGGVGWWMYGKATVIEVEVARRKPRAAQRRNVK
jgi:hypothetical protein